MNIETIGPNETVIDRASNEDGTPRRPLRRSANADRCIVLLLWFLTAIPAIPALGLLLVLLLQLSLPPFGLAPFGWSPQIPPSLSAMLNPIYLSSPWPILLHAGSGVVFFATMPWQFLPAFRQRYPRWHRRSGYLVSASLYGMAISGVWLHLVVTPSELGMRFVSLLLVSLGMIVALSIALQAVLQRDYARHQRWMLRTVAITLAVVTPLLLEVMLLLGQMLVIGILSLIHLTMQVVLPSAAAFTKPLALTWPLLQANITALWHDYGRVVGMLTNLWLVRLWLRHVSAHAKHTRS